MTDDSLRQQLERLTDEELIEIVRRHDTSDWQAAVFTVAEDILRSRGVDVAKLKVSSEPQQAQQVDEKLTTVARFATVVEAEACRSALVAAGFKVFGGDQFLLGVDPALGPALGGFRLAVPASEADEARSFLSAAEGGELGVELECSSCGSTDVACERKASRGGTFLNTWLVGPVVQDVTISYRCRKCGATWE